MTARDKSHPWFAQMDGCELLLHSKLCFQVEFQEIGGMGSNQEVTKVTMSLILVLNRDYRV